MSIKILLWISVLAGVSQCSNKAQDSGGRSGACAAGEACDSKVGPTSRKTAGDSDTSVYGDDATLPELKTANIDGAMNRNKAQSLVILPPEDKDRFLLVQKTKRFYPVWIDPRIHSSGWKEYDKTMAPVTGLDGFDSDKDGFLYTPSYKPDEKNVMEGPDGSIMRISIHQAMPDAVTLKPVDVAMGTQFHVVGHTVYREAKFPPYSSPVVSVYNAKDPDAMKPPKRYVEVYRLQGLDVTDLIKRCIEMQEKQAKAAGAHGSMPPVTDTIYCGIMLQGMGALTSYEAALQGQSNLSIDYFTKKLSVYIWRPIPPEGYQCLGDVVTNTAVPPGNLSDTMNMASQIGSAEYSQMSQTQEYATYCIKQAYLAEGRMFEYFHNDEVAIYAVGPKGNDGYDAKSGFFHAVNRHRPSVDKDAYVIPSTETGTDSDTAVEDVYKPGKVWVLKEASVKVRIGEN